MRKPLVKVWSQTLTREEMRCYFIMRKKCSMLGYYLSRQRKEGRSEANDKLSCDHEEQENLKKSCNDSVFFSKPNSLPSEGAYGHWFESVGGWIKLKTEECRLETKNHKSNEARTTAIQGEGSITDPLYKEKTKAQSGETCPRSHGFQLAEAAFKPRSDSFFPTLLQCLPG